MLVVNEKITKERTMATVLRKKYLKSKKYGNSVEKEMFKKERNISSSSDQPFPSKIVPILKSFALFGKMSAPSCC